MSQDTNTTTPTPATPYTSPADRLRQLQVHASFAAMAEGCDMTTLDAAATLETAADLLGDALAVCRWVAVLANYKVPPELERMAREVVRRADLIGEVGADRRAGSIDAAGGSGAAR